MCHEVGENYSDAEIQDMIDEAEKSQHKEGLIDFEDFFKVMSKNADDPMGDYDSEEDKCEDQMTGWLDNITKDFQ